VLGFLFPAQSEPAFALFKMMQAGFTAIAFLYGSYTTVQVCVLVLLAVGVVALVCVTILGICVAPLDKKRASEVGQGPVAQLTEETPLVTDS
jgi:hypothetical protein